MPDGRIVDEYFVLEYPNWVNAVAITADNKVLMVRQYRHAANIVSLEIPGGVIDGDEEPIAAMRRELLEVIRKYVNVDPEAVIINLERDQGHEVLELSVALPEKAQAAKAAAAGAKT